MADLFLTWDEAKLEQLPHYCVSCALPATEWADWRICKSQHQLFSHLYTYVNVTLPVCPRHRKLHWAALYRVKAVEIYEDGVVLGHVSPGFVEAVWDYRDDREAAEPEHFIPPARHSRRRDFVDDDDFFDYDVSPRRALPHRHRGRHYEGHPSPGWTAGKIVLTLLAVVFFAPCGLALIFGVLALIMGLAFG